MKNLKIIFIALLLTNCGFKVIDKSKLNNFSIAEISTQGDKRVNFNLKNKLNFASNEDEKRLIKISLETIKNKSVKERNIKNEITKYQIKIKIIVTCYEISSGKEIQFVKSDTGDYSVSSQYSQTINNEKKLVQLLTDYLAEQILEELTIKINDL